MAVQFEVTREEKYPNKIEVSLEDGTVIYIRAQAPTVLRWLITSVDGHGNLNTHIQDN
jgi:hypothetical protein